MVPPADHPAPLSVTRAFVVQFRADTAVEQRHLTGRVEHVVSGQATDFESLETLLAFMAPDTVFWIASMTKAITAAAAMQLVERDALQLDTPAADVMPELARVHVLTGFDASGTPQLRAPRRAMTLRHLLTHTAGFSQDIFSAEITQYQETTGTPAYTTFENAALTTPLVCDPGERWEYGINQVCRRNGA